MREMVAKTLMNSARSFDVVARWGGDEFIAVIANVDREQLIATANRFRILVEQSSRAAGPVRQVTISVGATLARSDDTEATLLERAAGGNTGLAVLATVAAGMLNLPTELIAPEYNDFAI